MTNPYANIAENLTWTLAYRKKNASTAKRVTNWAGTWDDALRMAGEFLLHFTAATVKAHEQYKGTDQTALTRGHKVTVNDE